MVAGRSQKKCVVEFAAEKGFSCKIRVYEDLQEHERLQNAFSIGMHPDWPHRENRFPVWPVRDEMNGHVVKPIDVAKLMEALREILGR